jgi:hypothetical protein
MKFYEKEMSHKHEWMLCGIRSNGDGIYACFKCSKTLIFELFEPLEFPEYGCIAHPKGIP